MAAAVVFTVVGFVAWSSINLPSAQVSREVAIQDTDVAQETATVVNAVVEIETTLGTIRAELFQDKAPITVENFADLVQQEFYDGIIFHRVISAFMIQTGDPLGTGTGGRTDKGLPAKHLRDEFHPDLRHDKPGMLSMANSGPNTGDTQFFITTVPTPWLDDKHSVFGQVTDGMDIVHKIENVQTGPNDRPVDEIKLVRVRMVGDQE